MKFRACWGDAERKSGLKLLNYFLMECFGFESFPNGMIGRFRSRCVVDISVLLLCFVLRNDNRCGGLDERTLSERISVEWNRHAH